MAQAGFCAVLGQNSSVFHGESVMAMAYMLPRRPGKHARGLPCHAGEPPKHMFSLADDNEVAGQVGETIEPC